MIDIDYESLATFGQFEIYRVCVMRDNVGIAFFITLIDSYGLTKYQIEQILTYEIVTLYYFDDNEKNFVSSLAWTGLSENLRKAIYKTHIKSQTTLVDVMYPNEIVTLDNEFSN